MFGEHHDYSLLRELAFEVSTRHHFKFEVLSAHQFDSFVIGDSQFHNIRALCLTHFLDGALEEDSAMWERDLVAYIQP
jgi:hypothetical protein